VLGRVASSMLYEVSGADPGIFVGASVFLFAFAVLATLLPARRAARLNPLQALHWE
jgi:putative ABC transport system permease protein